MQNRRSLLSTTPIFWLLLTIIAAGCGKRIEPTKTLSSNSSTVPSLPADTLACQMVPSANTLSAYTDANGNLTATPPAPTVVFRVTATRGGIPVAFRISQAATSSSDFRIEQGPSSSFAQAQELTLRPYKIGVHGAQVTIVSQDSTTDNALCTAQIELKAMAGGGSNTGGTPQLAITANGASSAITLPEGQGAILNWIAMGAGTCGLTRNNNPVTALTGTSGELTVGPFNNATNAPIVNNYEIVCVPAPGAAAIKQGVAITVNPLPTAMLEIAGAGATKTVRVGDNADLNWNSTFATRGCTLSDGLQTQNVNAMGTVRLTAIPASVRFTLTCRDGYRGSASASVNLIALNPRAMIAANGVRTAYVQPVRENFTVTWSAADVDSCDVAPLSDNRAVGSFVVLASTFRANGVFTITCQSPLGPVSDTVTVAYPGDWYQVDRKDFAGQEDCTNFCGRLGRLNIDSPDGSRCASGELLPPSALNKISFTKGCGKDYSCSVPHGANHGISDGKAGIAYCWGDGQKQNKNGSDEVQGCFCR